MRKIEQTKGLIFIGLANPTAELLSVGATALKEKGREYTVNPDCRWQKIRIPTPSLHAA
jgi:hypothetical protein